MAKNLLRTTSGSGPLKVIRVQTLTGGHPITWIAGGWRCFLADPGTRRTRVLLPQRQAPLLERGRFARRRHGDQPLDYLSASSGAVAIGVL